jgi:glycosyltransferase involved in cell wall biosynthesis
MTREPSSFLGQTVVVIPALNEAACIAETVRAWQRLGAARIRVVDNGSDDATAAAAMDASAEVFLEVHRGYGAAAWRGLQMWPSALPWVLFSAADGSDRLVPYELPAWQAAVDAGADLVVGDRVTSPESRVSLGTCQRLGNRITCTAIRLGWRRHFNDMGSVRLARRDELVALGLQDRGFGWNVEMQIRALESHWNIVELPVQYHPRTAGESKISGNFVGTVRAANGILRMLWLLWRLRRASQVSRGVSGAAIAGAANPAAGS